MNFLDSLLLAVKSVWSSKTRAILTILGVMIGPAALVGMTSLFYSFANTVSQDLLASFPQNVITVDSPIQAYQLNDISHNPHVSEVLPYYQLEGYVRNSSGDLVQVQVLAVNLNEMEHVLPSVEINSSPSAFPVIGGYFTTHSSILNFGQQSYLYLTKGQDIYVILSNFQENFTSRLVVTGCVEKEVLVNLPGVNTGLIVPLSVGERLSPGEYSGALVVVSNSTFVKEVANTIKSYHLSILLPQQNPFADLSSFSTTYGLLFSGAAFIVAFFSILSTMYTSVVERTHDIGILMSLGFKRRDIMMSFAAEGVVLGVIGAVVGVVLGIGGVLAYFTYASSSFQLVYGTGIHGSIDISAVYLALISTVIIALVASIAPAYKASRLEPARAVRSIY
ncbi:multidrug ABC transporter substrate-binding protein [Sulfolobales archaeon HS-7]|nr:multidrug ABC transporter substrate-binding protein [Sulfolobales archaeon HS-7]